MTTATTPRVSSGRQPIIKFNYGNLSTQLDDASKTMNLNWKMYPFQLNELKTSIAKSQYYSDEFQLGKNVKWTMILYPNGQNTTNVGFCMLFLNLKSMPKSYGKVMVYYNMRCNETGASYQAMEMYDKPKGWGFLNKSQPLSELTDLKEISFSCNFRILRIENKNGDPIYQYPLRMASVPKKERFTWNVDEALTRKMATATVGKRFGAHGILSSSGLFNIDVIPNNHGDADNSEENVYMYLVLCTLPIGISALKVQYRINVPELGTISCINTFDYDNQSYGAVMGKFGDLGVVESMQIAVETKILEVFDLNGAKMEGVQFQRDGMQHSVQMFSRFSPTLDEWYTEIRSVSFLPPPNGPMDEVEADGNEFVFMHERNRTIPDSHTSLEEQMSTHSDLQSICGMLDLSDNDDSQTSLETITKSNYGDLVTKFDNSLKMMIVSWTMDTDQLSAFQTSQVGSEYFSAAFQSEMSTEWMMEIDPNGADETNAGSLMLFLNLNSMPDSYGKMAVYYYLRCDETGASYQEMAIYDGPTACGFPARTQLLSELSHLDHLSFLCIFRILRIENKDGNPIYEYPLRIESISKMERFEWIADEQLTRLMAMATVGKMFVPQGICSSSGLFNFLLEPNGQESEGEVWVYLKLCALPIGASGLKVKYKIMTPELGETVSCTTTLDHGNHSWGAPIGKFQDFGAITSLKVMAETEILEVFDMNGTKMEDVQFKPSGMFPEQFGNESLFHGLAFSILAERERLQRETAELEANRARFDAERTAAARTARETQLAEERRRQQQIEKLERLQRERERLEREKKEREQTVILRELQEIRKHMERMETESKSNFEMPSESLEELKEREQQREEREKAERLQREREEQERLDKLQREKEEYERIRREIRQRELESEAQNERLKEQEKKLEHLEQELNETKDREKQREKKQKAEKEQMQQKLDGLQREKEEYERNLRENEQKELKKTLGQIMHALNVLKEKEKEREEKQEADKMQHEREEQERLMKLQREKEEFERIQKEMTEKKLERRLKQLEQELRATKEAEDRRKEEQESERLLMQQKVEKLQEEKKQSESAPAPLERQESHLGDNWDYREDRQVYEEDTTQTDLHVAVGKIAEAIVGTVSTIATGGALGPVLVASLKSVVLNAGWSQTDKKDKIVKKIFGQNICVYLEIDKITQCSNKNLMGSSRMKLHLKADTKFLVMTAKSTAAKMQLQQMKDNQANDKLQYISTRNGWCEEEKKKEEQLQQQKIESICNIRGICIIL